MSETTKKRGRKETGNLLRRFMAYYKPHKKLFAMDMAASLMVAVIGVVYPMITRTMLLMLLSDNHVKLIGDCKVKAIQKKGVKVEDRNWTETVLPADFVVDAFGMKSTRPEAEAYRELIPEVYILGDASEVKNIKKANFDTYNICCNI